MKYGKFSFGVEVDFTRIGIFVVVILEIDFDEELLTQCLRNQSGNG